MYFEDGDKLQIGKRYTLCLSDCCVSAQITGTCTEYDDKGKPVLSDVVLENWDGGEFDEVD